MVKLKLCMSLIKSSMIHVCMLSSTFCSFQMASPHKEMDSARKSKDKSYKHVFKGSVLINTLMEYDKGRFRDRAAAITFGQRLLDMNHVESIVGGKKFEDGAALYRWCDETLVRQAKKMVTTTSSHIPKRRLIELLDLQHGDGEDEAYDMGEMKTRVVGRLDGSLFEQPGAGTSGEGTTSADWPTHDPCGSNQAKHLTNVYPQGQIWLR